LRARLIGYLARLNQVLPAGHRPNDEVPGAQPVPDPAVTVSESTGTAICLRASSPRWSSIPAVVPVPRIRVLSWCLLEGRSVEMAETSPAEPSPLTPGEALAELFLDNADRGANAATTPLWKSC
jgi:hypothetical protein